MTSLAGYNERRCIARESMGLYGTVVFIATYSSTQPQDDLTGLIKRALERCIAQLDVLRAVILDADTERPRIGLLPTLGLRDHLTITFNARDNEDSVQRLLEFEHNTPLSDCHVRPQWRVNFHLLPPTPESHLTRFRLAWVCSHNLTDGMSGFVLHSEFLRALRAVGEPSAAKSITLSPVLPALNRAAKMPISWSFLLAPFLTVYLPPVARLLGLGLTSSKTGAWTGASVRPPKPTPPEMLRTNLRITSIPHELLEELSVTCRTKHVRMTGLLGVLIARTLAHALRNRGQDHNRFTVGYALNMRRALKLGHGCVANYPSGATDTYDIQLPTEGLPSGLTSDDWNAARTTTEHLHQVSNTLSDQPIALLGYLTSIRPWVLEQAEKAAEDSFEVSNLGVFPEDRIEGDDGWRVDDVVFSQSADAMRAPINVNICTSRQGPLNIVATWWPGMLGVEDEEALVEEMLEGIRPLMLKIV